MDRALRVLLPLLMLCAFPLASGAQVNAGATATEYILGVDDIVEIAVFGKPEFTGEVTVDFRGIIQVPLIGEVKAGGRSPSELGEYLSERYQLLDRSITEVLVSVVEYKSRLVTVVGEVRNAGPYGFVEIPGLWDVILLAGGPSPEADLSRVQIVRAPGSSQGTTPLLVDLSAGMDGVTPGDLPLLRPGDKIFVPSSEDVPVGSQDFQVLGAVNSPGTYRISVATNVVEALGASGGHLRDADLKRVYLTRPTPTGTQSYRLNLEDYLYDAQTRANLDLLAGDTITVPEKSGFVTSWSRVSGIFIPILSLAVTAVVATQR